MYRSPIHSRWNVLDATTIQRRNWIHFNFTTTRRLRFRGRKENIYFKNSVIAKCCKCRKIKIEVEQKKENSVQIHGKIRSIYSKICVLSKIVRFRHWRHLSSDIRTIPSSSDILFIAQSLSHAHTHTHSTSFSIVLIGFVLCDKSVTLDKSHVPDEEKETKPITQ